MIFRNRRQYLKVDTNNNGVFGSYHHLNGSYTQKMFVRNDAATNFKHPYYAHDRFWYDGNTHHMNMNGQGINGRATYGQNQRKAIAMHVLRGSALGNTTYLGGAVIRSKTATTGTFVSYAVARNREGYVHDKKMIMLNNDNMLQPKDGNGALQSTKIVTTKHSLRTFIPRGANTDIYGDETTGGGTTATGPKQTWIG